MSTFNALTKLRKAIYQGGLTTEEKELIRRAYSSYTKRKYTIREEDIAPILEKKLAALKEIKTLDLEACYNQPLFIQTFGRVYRNPKPNQTMSEQNLLPFNIDIAVSHPERVYNTASCTQNITCVTPLPDGSVAFQIPASGGSNGYIYPLESVVTFMRIVAAPEYKPWTCDTLPADVLSRVYRKKTDTRCVTNIRCVNDRTVWFGNHCVYLPELLDNYEWSHTIKGPWYPCGTESGTPTA